MSVPVGPHGSFEVAAKAISIARGLWTRVWPTISNLHLDGRVALGDILNAPHYFRHAALSFRTWCLSCDKWYGALDSIAVG